MAAPNKKAMAEFRGELKDDPLVRVVAIALESLFMSRPDIDPTWFWDRDTSTKLHTGNVSLLNSHVGVRGRDYRCTFIPMSRGARYILRLGYVPKERGMRGSADMWLDATNLMTPRLISLADAERLASTVFSKPFAVTRVSDEAIMQARSLVFA